jgi:outer membrane protein assembly factor BamB
VSPNSRRVGQTVLVLALVVTLGGCDVFRSLGLGGSGSANRNKIPGERLPALTFDETTRADPALADEKVVLPAPVRNAEWPSAGGTPSKSNQHLAVGDVLSRAWRVSIGDGANSRRLLVAPPVVAEGKLFAIDTEARVTAFNTANGARLWSVELARDGISRNVAFGGGVGYGDGRLYVTTGYGTALALDPSSGKELWRTQFEAPLRGSPAITRSRIFVVSYDNQLFALAADTGRQLWDTSGITEVANMAGAGTPAVSGDTLVVGFSSGELNALRVENGRVAWQDTLARSSRLTAVAQLSDIDGSPVIDAGRVYAIGNAGRMVALELASGERVWEKSIGGLAMPWIAGEYIFVVTSEAELLCLNRRDGRVRWITQLQRYDDPEDRKGPIRWQGPVLASDRLILVSTNDDIVTVSPYTGKILSREELPDSASLAPVVADGSLYILTNDGQITAYR